VRGLRGLFSLFVYKIIALYKVQSAKCEVRSAKSKEQRTKSKEICTVCKVRGLRGLFSLSVCKIIALYKEVFLQKSKAQRANRAKNKPREYQSATY